jgi:hypothetical protein
MLTRFAQKLASKYTYSQTIASKGRTAFGRALSSLHHGDNKAKNEKLVASDKLIKPLERLNGKILFVVVCVYVCVTQPLNSLWASLLLSSV